MKKRENEWLVAAWSGWEADFATPGGDAEGVIACYVTCLKCLIYNVAARTPSLWKK